MPRGAVSRTANVGTVGKNGLKKYLHPKGGSLSCCYVIKHFFAAWILLWLFIKAFSQLKQELTNLFHNNITCLFVAKFRDRRYLVQLY